MLFNKWLEFAEKLSIRSHHVTGHAPPWNRLSIDITRHGLLIPVLRVIGTYWLRYFRQAVPCIWFAYTYVCKLWQTSGFSYILDFWNLLSPLNSWKTKSQLIFKLKKCFFIKKWFQRYHKKLIIIYLKKNIFSLPFAFMNALK